MQVPPLTSDRIVCFIVELVKNVSADQTNCKMTSESQNNSNELLSSDGKTALLSNMASKPDDLLTVSSDNLQRGGVITSDDMSDKRVTSDTERFDTEDFTHVAIDDRPRFTRHMDEHGKFHKEELHQCERCQGMFLKSSYVDHVSYCAKQTSLCGNDKVFLCKLCGLRGIRYNKHCEEHLANRPYKCSECTFSSNNKVRVQRHCLRPACAVKRATRVVTTNDRKCGTCGEVFQDKKLYQKHYIEAHMIMLKQFDWCNDCGLWIKSEHIAHHRKTTHTATYSCDVCGMTFKTKRGRNKHKVTHEEATRPCEYCGKKFKTVQDLRQHVVGVHETVGKKHRCSHCGKFYKSAESLQSHIGMYHGPPVEYSCEVWGKCFKTAINRRAHMLTHTEDRPFKCVKCQKGFKSSQALQNHMVSHSDERKYKCDTCGDAFKQPSHLKYHLLKHTGVRAFHCDYCGKSFQRKQILETHILSHTGQRPFSCADCKKDFLRKTDLNKHLRDFH